MLRRIIVGFLVGYGIGSLIAHLILVISANADAPKAFQSLRQTAVMINGGNCSGSGSIVEGRSGNRFLITNAHVCLCSEERGYIYGSFDSGELVRAKVEKKDWGSDLCAARVEEKRPALKIGPQLIPFMHVHTRGYGYRRLVESSGTVGSNVEWAAEFDIGDIGSCPEGAARGYGLNGRLAACQFHYTSTLTNLYARPGASGSAVVDDEGRLVGVVSSWHPSGEYETGMVPFSDVERFVSAL